MKIIKQNTILLFIMIIINSCTVSNEDVQNQFINDFLTKNIYNGSHFFEINASKDTTISIDMDLKIQIPAFTFIDTNNHIINKNVKLEVKKVRDKISAFTNQLSTQTNKNELLETDGMIYINALCDNQKVRIAEGKKIAINFLPLKPIKTPNLYKGVKKDDIVFWEIIPNNLQNLFVLPQKKLIRRPDNSSHLGDSFTILFQLYQIIWCTPKFGQI
jgi:hypothetical protein